MSANASLLPFDLRSLEIFLAVCETRSMAAAARLIGLTQPAVSIAVSELERKTATHLFSRDVRPLALTAAGEILRQRAASIVADARQLPALLRDARLHKAPAIKIGIVDSLNRVLTVPLVRFLQKSAEEVSVLSGLTATHASDLLTRRLDVFAGVDDLEDQTGLERWRIATEPYVLVLPPKSKPVETVAGLKALAGRLPLVRFSARSQTGIEIERHLRRLGLDCAKTVECDNPYAVTKLVAEGAGFAISTPLCVHEASISDAKLLIAAVPGPKFTRHLTLVARNRELGNLPREIASLAQEIIGSLDLPGLGKPSRLKK